MNLIDKRPLVLVVNDVERNADVFARKLREGGYAASTAISAAKALETIQVVPPDCMIVDAIMPDMDGYSLTQEVRKQHPVMPVIITTPLDPGMDRIKAMKAGANLVVGLTIGQTELLAIVESLLGFVAEYNKIVVERDQLQRAFDALQADMRRLAVRNTPLA